MTEKTVDMQQSTPANVREQDSHDAQGGEPLLEVRDLKVTYDTYAGRVQSVRGVSFEVPVGGTLAIVGESGCGKSVTAKAIMGLIKKPGKVDPDSQTLFEGKDVMKMTPEELRAYKGGSVSMVFQEALQALDPTMRVGKQICETLLAHGVSSKEEAKARAIELLREMGIPEPERRFKQFPHELSGGMRQRVMIATAIACVPKLLVARRAHHRPGRDHPGPDPGQDPRDPADAGHGGHHDHARHGHRGEHRPAHRGHVRRHHRGARHGARGVRSASATPTPTRFCARCPR